MIAGTRRAAARASTKAAMAVRTGSDGSKIDFHVTEHFTVNANGTVTSEFEKVSC